MGHAMTVFHHAQSLKCFPERFLPDYLELLLDKGTVLLGENREGFIPKIDRFSPATTERER
jgi:hypothetical protein